jgi:hypothetical protein
MYTEQITQRLAISNGITPQILNNATLNSGSVDMSLSERALFVLTLGAVTSGGSINAALYESSDNSTFTALANGSGSGSAVAVTGLTTAPKITTFEVRADQLTKRYVRLQITETGSENVYVAVTGFGDEGIHKPNNPNNGANVATQNVDLP